MTDSTAGACIFCGIVRREIPAHLVHEEEEVVAFEDLNPQAPVHVLVIPRRHVASVDAFTGDDTSLAGRLILAGAEVARRFGVAEDGYRLVLNTGDDAGQSVHHVHLHVLGGRRLGWPPG